MHCVRCSADHEAAPVRISPVIGALAMRISLSHLSTALAGQPVTDFALSS